MIAEFDEEVPLFYSEITNHTPPIKIKNRNTKSEKEMPSQSARRRREKLRLKDEQRKTVK